MNKMNLTYSTMLRANGPFDLVGVRPASTAVAVDVVNFKPDPQISMNTETISVSF